MNFSFPVNEITGLSNIFLFKFYFFDETDVNYVLI